MLSGEKALFEFDDRRREANDLLDELSTRGIPVSLYIDRFTDLGQPAIQIQLKAKCADNDLLLVAETARAKGYAVDAEDGALLINVM